MDIQTLEIVQTANRLVDTFGTRDPHRIAQALGIEVISVDFKRQRGAYKVLMRNRFIFIKNDLDPVTERVVMLHEIGHDVLHRKEAVKAGGFKEFNIFNMRENRMEYEANVFASQVSLDDEEILEYIHYGYDIQRIASAMHTDANLVVPRNNRPGIGEHLAQPRALEAGMSRHEHFLALIKRQIELLHFAHTFHGALPDAHSCSSFCFSRSVSMHCQKPWWMYPTSCFCATSLVSGPFSNTVSS